MTEVERLSESPPKPRCRRRPGGNRPQLPKANLAKPARQLVVKKHGAACKSLAETPAVLALVFWMAGACVHQEVSVCINARTGAVPPPFLTLRRYNELDAAGPLAANEHYRNKPRMDNLRRSRRRLRTERNLGQRLGGVKLRTTPTLTIQHWVRSRRSHHVVLVHVYVLGDTCTEGTDRVESGHPPQQRRIAENSRRCSRALAGIEDNELAYTALQPPCVVALLSAAAAAGAATCMAR
jgi:hypothetical protein